jgi:exopolysaccharide biosynthesis WecB/TagA/CpsF family protein
MAFDGALRQTSAVSFLGFHFDGLDIDAAMDAITVRASLELPFAYVATPNVAHVVDLAAEPARRPLYEAAWLTLNDSRILQRLAARAGLKLPHATGADIAERLLDTVIHRHEPVVIIGGAADDVAALERRYGLTNVRWHDAPMDLKRNPHAIVDAANFAAKHDARFTFICVGAPQQEMIAYAIAQRGDAIGVGLCVGAALEFLSGRKARAPRWMRLAGLEWLHRLSSEPTRLWRRYLVEGPKVFALFATWRASMAAASAA